RRLRHQGRRGLQGGTALPGTHRDRHTPGRPLSGCGPLSAGGAGTVTTTLNRSVLIGLIGHGVGPSLTPPMHEMEGARQGLRYLYRTIEFRPDNDPRRRLSEL